MALNPDRPNSRGNRTRRVIAESAQGLFRGHGWRITRRRIADIAKVSRSTIAAHFPTLRSLVHYVYADEVANMSTAISNATARMSVARTFKERDDVITDFIQVIAEAVGCRPMLAMSLLPFQLDPWSSEKGKAPKVEEVTFDMLVRTLRGLLCAYWSEDHSDPQYLTRLTELVAKQTVLGMLSAAANKRDEDDIVEATTYMLM